MNYKSISVMLLLSVSNLSASDMNIDTIAGELSFYKNPLNHQCEFLISKRSVIHFDCEYAYAPRIIGNIRGDFGDVTQLIIIQESPMGNACNGGPLHLLGVIDDKSLLTSHEFIDFCGGGGDPVVTNTDRAVTITFPGGSRNRGEGLIPTVVW